MDCLELTKAIHPYRGYPDPAYYNAFPGGLPSGVHLHGLTLEEAPVWARGTGTNTANLYQDPEKPAWRVLLRNLTAKPVDAEDVTAALLALEGKAAEPPENPMSADRVRWEHIQRIYELCNRNVSETARRLNMHRRTLQRILAKRAPK